VSRYDPTSTAVAILPENLKQDAFVKKRWAHLDGIRQSILTRCEQYSEWTLPSVFPRPGLNEDTELQLDYQSLGAEAVNNMANKLALTLLTPHRPFFRLNITAGERQALQAEGMEPPMIEAVLAQTERDAMTELERIGVRTATVDAAKLLLITGNALIKIPKEGDEGQASTFSLRRYVVRRDASGNVIEIIIRQVADLNTFSEENRTKIIMARELNEKDKPDVELFTYMTLIKNRWELVQAADDATLEDSHTIYPKKKLPYIVLVWNRVDNETYGRGLVEDYAGDFHGYHGLSEAGANLTAILCDIKFLSDPRAGNDIETLNNSASGTYVAAVPDTIGTSTSSIITPTDMLEMYLSKYERRIGRAFLLNSSMVRDAERVTAAEIRFMSDELQTSHGSVYANLNNTFQAQLANLLLQRLDFDLVESEPTIVTGLDSLARSADINNLRLWLQDMALLEQVPEGLLTKLKTENIAAALASGYGISHTDYVMNDKEQEAARDKGLENELGSSIAQNAGAALTQPQE
tara:strand:- start:122 stop:1687 length:1566 start_codon:yes stop_codon:yes gene_type:complete